MRPAPVVLAVLVVAVVGTGPSPASQQPEGVTCSYDESELREYQPETAVDHLDVEPTASYAGVYSSPERGVDVYVYVLRYDRQSGVTAVDSHAVDREPVYVLVDDATGAVERVVYSAYHYVKGAGTPSKLPMNGSHVKLHVVDPWHQYAPTTESGSRVPLKNYCDAVDAWHANGWDASVEATTNPWTMTDRDSWWSQDSLDGRMTEEVLETRQELGDLTPDLNVSVPSARERSSAR